MEDGDGALNKRGDAYCACRYLNCGRKFKSLKALEEHLISSHNISWEAYTRYSPTRHHETIEEVTSDSLGKRKDAYCTCTYMECGRKFKMLQNLEEHVTLYHNISWQLYTQYYHRAVRKSPEEKSKSPKSEPKSSPFSAVKTSDSPSPSARTVRSSSNGSATTPVSVGMGISSPVSPSPVMSYLPQTNPPSYGQYPYLAAQLPVVPAIIQYQPMLTAPVIGYASPSTLPLSQGYLGQSAIPMSPLPESVSWYSGQPNNHYLYQQQQQDSAILNLSCPKSKKTKSSPPPAKSVDLSKPSPKDQTSAFPKDPQSFFNSELSSKLETNYRKAKDMYRSSFEKPDRIQRENKQGTSPTETPKLHVKTASRNQSNLPDTKNGVIVIQPDEDYDDTKYGQTFCENADIYKNKIQQQVLRQTDHRGVFKDGGLNEATAYLNGAPQGSNPPANHMTALPRIYTQEQRLEDMKMNNPKCTYEQTRTFSVTEGPHSVTTHFSSSCSSGPYKAEKQTSSQRKIPYILEKKTDKIYDRIQLSESKEIGSNSSPPMKTSCKSLSHQISSGLFHSNQKIDIEGDLNKKCEQSSFQVGNLPGNTSGKGGTLFFCKKNSLSCKRKLKRSSSLPNLKTCSEGGDDYFPEDRLVIDISDEEQTLGCKKMCGPSKISTACSKNCTNYSKNANSCCSPIRKCQKPPKKDTTKNKLKFRPQTKRRAGTIPFKSKTKCRKISTGVHRTNRIKRKYRYTVQRILQRKKSHLASHFRSLILLNMRSEKNKLGKQSCDTYKFGDGGTSVDRKKLHSRHTKKGIKKQFMPLTFPQHLTSTATHKTNFGLHCSVEKSNLPKSYLPLNDQQKEIERNTELVSSSEDQKPSVLDPCKVHRFFVVCPLKVLAELSYRAYERKIETNQGCSQNKHPTRETHSSHTSDRSSSHDNKRQCAIYHQGKNLTDVSCKIFTGMAASGLRSSTRIPAMCYQWRTLKFIHRLTYYEDQALFCNACKLHFKHNADYVRHRLSEHRSYRCKVCDDCKGCIKRRGHLFRYLSTLTRHLMLDHGVTSALDPHLWVIQDSYGGIDLQGIPFLDNLDQLSLVTNEKIYMHDVVYTYKLQLGTWTLSHITSTDSHKMAAQSEAASPERSSERGVGRLDSINPHKGITELSTLSVNSGNTVKVNTVYPPVLMTIIEAQYLAPGKTSSASQDKVQLSKV